MRTIFTFISLMLFVTAFSQNDKNFHSHWRAGNTNIQKLADDSYEFFKKGNFLYYVSNDKDNIYIDIKIEDSGVQYKILQEGMTVWFNADGKPRKEVGIRFPLGAKFSKGLGMHNPGGFASDSPLAMANTIQLIGFGGPGPDMIPAKNSDDFSGSMQYDNDGNLFYSLRMPVSKLSFINSDKGGGFEPCTIGIEYGGIPEMGRKPAAQAPPQISDMPSGGSRGGGGGGGRGGSRGGGGRGGATGGAMGGAPTAMTAQAVETSKLLWIKNVSLADQP